MKGHSVDKIFLGLTVGLLLVGAFMFVSASLGILVRSENVFYSVLFNQLILGLGAGFVAMYFTSKINYKFWQKYSLYFFIGAILLTLAVFIPHLGFSHGGARRWITFGFVSFQPAELLKIAFIIYFASWLSWTKNKISDFKWHIIPLIIMFGIIALVLFKQPDTKSFILIVTAGLSMLFIYGVKWRYIFGMGVLLITSLLVLAFFTPYLKDRVKTFIDPSRDPHGASYQLEQSLIAIGSGGLFGRGFGQSIQKYNYLPEPQGDSIFAVVGEEFGFVGSTILVLLFVAFAMRGLKIASRAPDSFGRLLVAGIVILLIAQSFLNIASITGLFPLTGVPLVFISHGGTSLLFSMAAIGIVLNVSKFQKRNL